MIERRDAGGVIAAVFEAFERVDEMGRDRRAPEDSDYAAHPEGWPPLTVKPGLAAAGNVMEIKTHFAL